VSGRPHLFNDVDGDDVTDKNNNNWNNINSNKIVNSKSTLSPSRTLSMPMQNFLGRAENIYDLFISDVKT